MQLQDIRICNQSTCIVVALFKKETFSHIVNDNYAAASEVTRVKFLHPTFTSQHSHENTGTEIFFLLSSDFRYVCLLIVSYNHILN